MIEMRIDKRDIRITKDNECRCYGVNIYLFIVINYK